MRRHLVAIVALAAAAAAQSGLAAAAGQTPASTTQSSQAQGGQNVPTFRVGTDLLTLEISVLDRNGHPVEGLRPEDFSVKINGQTRRVTAAELVHADRTVPDVQTDPAVTQPPAPLVAPPKGRRFLIAVDQQYIPAGSIKPLLNAAGNFVDRMTGRDEAAFVAFPEPGPHVDFTSDKARLHEAMQGLVGQPRKDSGEVDIGFAEALTVNDRERLLVNTLRADVDPTRTPSVYDIMERNDCLDLPQDEKVKCLRQIISDSMQIAQEVRLDAKISVRTLESIIGQLAKVEGTKTLILVSASLTMDNRHDLDALIRLAAAARVSINVIIVDSKRENVRVSKRQTTQTSQDMADRRLITDGLEELAAEDRGSVFRLADSGEGIFKRIGEELSASYVLGVESKPEDLRGDIGKVDVAIPRQKFKVRVSQAFARAPAAAPLVPRSLEENLRSALAAPSAFTDLRLQVATYTQWDPASDKVRVRLAAEVRQPGIQAGEYIVGYVVTDGDNRTVAEWSHKQASSTPGSRGSAQSFEDPLLLEPGVYSLRLGIVDSGGRQGTVIREVTVQRSRGGDLATSDLIVGTPPPPGQMLRLSAEPHVTGSVAAYIELYSAMPEDLDWTFVSFEIAKDATSPALVTGDADVVDGSRPSWRVATGFVDASALEPGPYVARARAVRDGKTVGVVTRPFVVERARGETRPTPK